VCWRGPAAERCFATRWFYRGMAEAALDRIEDAEATLRRAERLAERIGNHAKLVIAQSWLACLLYGTARWDEAVRAARLTAPPAGTKTVSGRTTFSSAGGVTVRTGDLTGTATVVCRGRLCHYAGHQRHHGADRPRH
jgi:hypothetical protein